VAYIKDIGGKFLTSTAAVVDSGGKFTEVGSPQISSTNRNKFADLNNFYIYGPSTSVAICRFAICDLQTQIPKLF
jgi:hypothetical protein